MDQLLEAAFIKAISIENQSLSFYRTMALRVGDEWTIKIFERMAEEESEHLKSFWAVYPGDVPELLNKVIRNNMFEETKYQELHDPVNAFIDELKALEISLLEERLVLTTMPCLSKYFVTPVSANCFSGCSRILAIIWNCSVTNTCVAEKSAAGREPLPEETVGG